MSAKNVPLSLVCVAGALALDPLSTPVRAEQATVEKVDDRTLKLGESVYTLAWSDEFDYADTELDKAWESQNAPSTHILCSRWRENARVDNGTLKLINRKEKRGGQEWTSGSIWTRQQFKYGFFECRYRYAAAEGTNNSFWIMTRDPGTGPFEIDINEGHYPNEVNTNIHYWSHVVAGKGRQNHKSASRTFPFGGRTEHVLQLEQPVTARKVRLTSTQTAAIAISDLSVLAPTAPKEGDTVPVGADLARLDSARVTVSGSLKTDETTAPDNVVDEKKETAWISQRDGEKWIEIDLGQAVQIGTIRFQSGLPVAGSSERKHPVNAYTLQYSNGDRWIDMTDYDISKGEVNLARDFHTYALEWTESELVFYFNGKEIRREKNTGSHRAAPVWLSLAIIPWAGRITDAIDGTFMEVDYVRVYQPAEPAGG